MNARRQREPTQNEWGCTMDKLITRRERKKNLTRETLTKAALKIISQQGIYVTTIEDVTGKADIGKGTFYQYFSSKEELLGKLLEDGLNQLLVKCNLYLEGSKELTEVTHKLFKAHLDFFFMHKDYLLLFHQVRGLLQLKHRQAENLKNIYSEYLKQIASLLYPFLHSKEKSLEKSLAIASFSTGLITHYLLFHKRLGLQWDSKSIGKYLLDALNS